MQWCGLQQAGTLNVGNRLLSSPMFIAILQNKSSSEHWLYPDRKEKQIHWNEIFHKMAVGSYVPYLMSLTFILHLFNVWRDPQEIHFRTYLSSRFAVTPCVISTFAKLRYRFWKEPNRTTRISTYRIWGFAWWKSVSSRFAVTPCVISIIIIERPSWFTNAQVYGIQNEANVQNRLVPFRLPWEGYPKNTHRIRNIFF